jgi:hypothetical protein
VSGRTGHNAFGGGIGSLEFPGHPAFVQNKNTVREAEDFGQLGGDEHNGQTCAGEVVDMRINLLFRANINAPSRLVQK